MSFPGHDCPLCLSFIRKDFNAFQSCIISSLDYSNFWPSWSTPGFLPGHLNAVAKIVFLSCTSFTLTLYSGLLTGCALLSYTKIVFVLSWSCSALCPPLSNLCFSYSALLLTTSFFFFLLKRMFLIFSEECLPIFCNTFFFHFFSIFRCLFKTYLVYVLSTIPQCTECVHIIKLYCFGNQCEICSILFKHCADHLYCKFIKAENIFES